MKLAITARIQKLFDRYLVRITIGVLLSLLVHGFILSLQLGIPGFGLPGLELPWSERRAQTPELSIRIANLAAASTVEPQALSQPVESDAPPKPQQMLQQPSNNQPLTELPNARVKQTPLRSASNSLRIAKALKSTPALAAAVRKNGTPPPDDQAAPAPARSQSELIALTDDRPSSFVVPAPDLDEWWRTAPKIAGTPIPVQPLEEAAAPAIAMQTPKQSLEQATEPAPAVQKPTEQESFERPDETQAKEPTPTKTTDVAMELAARKQGEEIAQQETIRNAAKQEVEQLAKDTQTIKLEETRKQEADEAARMLAAQKQEEEQTTLRNEELAAKKVEEAKIEDAKRQALADAALQAKALEARRQAEEITRQQAAALALQKQLEAAQKQAEEIRKAEQEKAERQAMELAAQQQAEEVARQKAASLERQKQEEQLAAQQKAQELAARQKADADNAQRENVRLAAAAAAAASSSNNGAGNTNGVNEAGIGAGIQPGGLGEAGPASKPLEKIGKLDLRGVAPAFAIEANRPEENSRRHSIFGSIDHDIGLAMYIEGWRTKIERNGNLNYAQSSKDKARESPVVTVAIRSDGSIEDIVINRSSGRADLDEAVRRIVRVNARYSAFPASLARKYDVIEIRRVWNFEDRIRLLEEVH